MESNKITILIISYRSLEKLKSCIKTIGSNKEIIVIEEKAGIVEEQIAHILFNYKNRLF